MKTKVVDVSIQVTCLEEDVAQVCEELNRWFCDSEIALVQRPSTGGIRTGTPRPVRKWMRETLGL